MNASVRALLRARWDVLTGRFQVFFASTPDEVKACVAVLEEVRRVELNRVANGSVVASHALPGEAAGGMRLVGCRDRTTGQVVGCMRVTPALAVAGHPDSVAEYRLNLMDAPLLERTVILTRLCVLRSHRATAASFSLFRGAFAALLEEGVVAALLSCEPGLYKMYLTLGGQPLGPVHNARAGGYRIPVVCIPDPQHLRRIRSPLRGVLSRADPAAVEPFVRWYAGVAAGLQGQPLGFRAYVPGEDECHAALTRDMSDRGTRALLGNAMVVQCRREDVLMQEGDGGKFLSVVRRGLVEVQTVGFSVRTLGPGAVLGEVALALDAHRSAHIVAREDSEVLLLSATAPSRLPLADRAVFWRNVARCLGERLMDMTQRVARQDGMGADARPGGDAR